MNQRATIYPSQLSGEVHLSGAKNSVLKLLAGALLTSNRCVLENVPSSLVDFRIQLGMLEHLGKRISENGASVAIEERETPRSSLAEWEGSSVRSSLLYLGALLTRFGEGKVPLPGGCKLGDRKYDLHVHIMEAMGAKVWVDGDLLCATAARRLRGAEIHLPIRSTGATENGILMACLAEGETTIWNPHVRPEILDLIAFLRKMGAVIEVFGQESIRIVGQSSLAGADHCVIPDNLEAITYLAAAAVTGSEIKIHGFPVEHLEVPLIHLRASGIHYFSSSQDDTIITRPGTIYPFDIATGPYPGINSDMQPIFAALGLLARGESHITDLRFPGRYQYAQEFVKLGADIESRGDVLVINGGVKLAAGVVDAPDLRGGAALVLCGLMAEAPVVVRNFGQVRRGYDRIVEKLRGLGARVEIDEGDE